MKEASFPWDFVVNYWSTSGCETPCILAEFIFARRGKSADSETADRRHQLLIELKKMCSNVGEEITPKNSTSIKSNLFRGCPFIHFLWKVESDSRKSLGRTENIINVSERRRNFHKHQFCILQPLAKMTLQKMQSFPFLSMQNCHRFSLLEVQWLLS